MTSVTDLIAWWIYAIILVLLSFVLIVSYILRNINVLRPVERLESQHETAVSAQTSFIADRNARRTHPINLKEDKRTSKSLSLVFRKEKSPAYTNLHDIVNDARGKTLDEKIIRLDPSANTDRDTSRCTTVFSATSNTKGLSNSKLCKQDVPNSELRLIKNVSSSKGNVIFGKSDEFLKDSIKHILPSVKDNKNELISEGIDDSKKFIASVSLEIDKTLFKNVQEPEQNNTNLHEEPTTPIDFHKDMKQFSTVEENVNSSNKKSVIINDTTKDISAPPKHEKTMLSIELITPKESYKINSPSKVNEDIDKNDEEIVNNNDSSKNNLDAIKDSKYHNEFIKAKDSVPNMLRCDKNINENFESVNYSKDHASIVISTSNTDIMNNRSNDITSNIYKEPSSLFFSTLAPCPPCTPKEIFAPYENALKSGKSLKTDTCNNNTIPVTESKHAADVRFNPETKTSYFQVKKDEIASNPKTGLSQISGTKDNISKSASRVTFAKNEIVLKDSVSLVRVVNSTTAALANDYETNCCNEFAVESESNIELEESTTADSKDKTKKDASSPFKRDIVNEAITVTNIFYPPHINQKFENITDSYNYVVEESQTFSEQSENISEKDFLSKEDHLNTKLVERLPTVAKDEEFRSRSLATVFINDDCTSCNNVHYSEVLIVTNNFSGNSTKAEKTPAQKNVDEFKKEILEIDDKVGTLSIEMINLKSVRDDTKTDARNQNEDDGENT